MFSNENYTNRNSNMGKIFDKCTKIHKNIQNNEEILIEDINSTKFYETKTSFLILNLKNLKLITIWKSIFMNEKNIFSKKKETIFEYEYGQINKILNNRLKIIKTEDSFFKKYEDTSEEDDYNIMFSNMNENLVGSFEPNSFGISF